MFRSLYVISCCLLPLQVSAVGSISKQYLPPCPVDVVLCLSTPDPSAQGGRLAVSSCKGSIGRLLAQQMLLERVYATFWQNTNALVITAAKHHGHAR